MIRWMPIAGGDDRQPLRFKSFDIIQEDWNDFIAFGNSQGAAGQKIMLDISDQQGIPGDKGYG